MLGGQEKGEVQATQDEHPQRQRLPPAEAENGAPLSGLRAKLSVMSDDRGGIKGSRMVIT